MKATTKKQPKALGDDAWVEGILRSIENREVGSLTQLNRVDPYGLEWSR